MEQSSKQVTGGEIIPADSLSSKVQYYPESIPGDSVFWGIQLSPDFLESTSYARRMKIKTWTNRAIQGASWISIKPSPAPINYCRCLKNVCRQYPLTIYRNVVATYNPTLLFLLILLGLMILHLLLKRAGKSRVEEDVNGDQKKKKKKNSNEV